MTTGQKIQYLSSTVKIKGLTRKSQTPFDLHVCQISEVVLSHRLDIEAELHYEIGQNFTAVLLDLKRVADQAPDPVLEQLHQAQETTSASLDDIRRLRPGVLEELGLTSALKSRRPDPYPIHRGSCGR
jgi:signal transduction histidine kinase